MVRGRAAWLGRPWFFVAVVVLALNDHVFKDAWPGWITGKLSDVAGVVVVATVLAVISGPTWGVALAGLGFAALKTIPGIAEAVSPLLGGGVVLRDPSDLIALGVVPPLWWLLRRERPDQKSRDRRAWQAVGLIAAVLATTATSQAEPRYVALGSGAGEVYARVDPGSGFDNAFLASADGGRTWARTPVSPPASSAVDWDVQQPGADVRAQVCAADGTCYRIRPGDDRGLVVERSAAGSAWQRDGEVPYNVEPDLAIDATSSDRVVALGTERTVFFRQSAGDWIEVDLGPVAAPPAWQLGLVTTMASRGGVIATFSIALVLILLLVPWTSVKVVMGVLDLVISGFALAIAGFFVDTFVATTTIGWLVAVVVLGVLMRVTWRVERRSRQEGYPASERGRPPTGRGADRSGRRRGLVAGAVAVLAALALVVVLAEQWTGPGGERMVSLWPGSRALTVAVASGLSVLGWVALRSLAAKWLAQVITLLVAVITYPGSSVSWLLWPRVPAVWLYVGWVGLTVAGIMLARSSAERGARSVPSAPPRGSGFDPPRGAL